MLKFLYENPLGRILLKLVTRPVCSKIGGWALGTRLSRCFVAGYIRRNRIDMSRFEERKYRSFNDFFTRRLKYGRWNETHRFSALTAPCDGRASAHHLTGENVFHIKNARYTIKDLLDDEQLAEQYMGGVCLIFRLTPDDYHRYHYICDGEIIAQRPIRGVLHTVRPIAHAQYPVFVQNSRVCTVMRTAQFGVITQIEVGALMVGKIINGKASGAFSYGEEKGHFAFGGSTIILLIEQGRVDMRLDLIDAAVRGDEIPVRVGEVIGEICEGEI